MNTFRKKAIVAVLVMCSFCGLTATTAQANTGPDSPAGDNAATCVGQNRAERNSIGGDREKGGLGQVQYPFVVEVRPYGQLVQILCLFPY